jgi:hypothetical protein
MSDPIYEGWIKENGVTRWGTSDQPIKEHAWRIEAGKVYWGDSGKPMRGADAATFQVLNEIWARDAKRVFVHDSVIPGADAESFEVFNKLYARDRGRAYYSFGIIKTADPSTFRALDSGVRKTRSPWKSHSGFAADRDAVYYYKCTIGKPTILKGADAATFEPIGCDFGKDARNVFYTNAKVAKANPATFRLLGLHYATDGKRVFYGNRLVEGADAESFQEDPDDDLNGRDRFGSYRWGKATYG